jgi:hypothetical protein
VQAMMEAPMLIIYNLLHEGGCLGNLNFIVIDEHNVVSMHLESLLMSQAQKQRRPQDFLTKTKTMVGLIPIYIIKPKKQKESHNM